MKMKITRKKITATGRAILSRAIGPVVCGLFVMSANAANDTATITITGKVLANTCTIDSKSALQNITLPDIADRDIKGVGRTGGDKDVNILLKGCGEGATKVDVTVSGSADSENTSAFKNSITDGAKGVALYFYQTDKVTKFSPSGLVKETSTLTPSADNTLTYKASYVGTNDTVKAGGFSTIVNMTFAYQ